MVADGGARGGRAHETAVEGRGGSFQTLESAAELVGAHQNRYKERREGHQMDQRAGGHRWPFDGSKCIVCGMTQLRFADTKKPCPGPQSERERLTVPDDDDE
jgi:hypothetical protein